MGLFLGIKPTRFLKKSVLGEGLHGVYSSSKARKEPHKNHSRGAAPYMYTVLLYHYSSAGFTINKTYLGYMPRTHIWNKTLQNLLPHLAKESTLLQKITVSVPIVRTGDDMV